MPKTVNEPTQSTRAFQMSLDIDVSPQDLWRALTEAGELVRWFSPEARVTPGVGGTMTWSSWSEGWDWETGIEAWEPGRLLRLVQKDARPYDTQGRPLPAGVVEPARIAMEFTLETHQGKTRLKLVHSGFGQGASWDNELEGITEGWQAELRGLRHYLQRHFGRDRHFGRAWLTSKTPRDAAWDRLLGPGGFRVSPTQLTEGQLYQVTTPGGQRFTGTVELYLPRQTLAGTVSELDDGWFRLLTWTDAKGDTGVWAWIATYTGEDPRVGEFRDQGQQALERLFPA